MGPAPPRSCESAKAAGSSYWAEGDVLRLGVGRPRAQRFEGAGAERGPRRGRPGSWANVGRPGGRALGRRGGLRSARRRRPLPPGLPQVPLRPWVSCTGRAGPRGSVSCSERHVGRSYSSRVLVARAELGWPLLGQPGPPGSFRPLGAHTLQGKRNRSK